MTAFFFLTLQHISPPSDLTFRVFFSVTFHVHSRSQWLEESGKTHAQKEEEEINLKRKQPYIWWTRFNVELICRLEWPVISMRHQPSYPIYVLCLPIFFLFLIRGGVYLLLLKGLVDVLTCDVSRKPRRERKKIYTHTDIYIYFLYIYLEGEEKEEKAKKKKNLKKVQKNVVKALSHGKVLRRTTPPLDGRPRWLFGSGPPQRRDGEIFISLLFNCPASDVCR